MPGWVIHMVTEGLVRAAVVYSEEERRLVVDVRRVKAWIVEVRKASAYSAAAAAVAVVVPC